MTMKVMRHLARVGRGSRPRAVAIGAFDGLHAGHQRVLQRLVECAAGLGAESVVVIPYPPVYAAPPWIPMLTTLRQRLEGIAACGVEALVLDRRLPAPDAPSTAGWVRDVLVDQLGACAAVAGEGGAWTRAFAGAGCLAAEVVSAVRADGQPVRTAAIRAAVAQGDIGLATRMLGRAPAVGGRVVHGHHRGARLGVPTANLRLRGVQLPPDGVYAVRVRVGAVWRGGVANIGFNPTFGNRERSVEAHLFDFSGDLYGRHLEVGFVTRLRGERKFADVQALAAQIHADIAAARRVLAEHGG